jgi:hypothetical protein
MSGDLPESQAAYKEELRGLANSAVQYVMSKVFSLDTMQAFHDKELKASVLFLAQYIMLPKEALTSLNDIMNRKKLNDMFRNPAACESDEMFSQLVVPLLLNVPTITGVPEHSKGYAAARDYAAKFLTMVDKLHALQRGATTESLTHAEQVDFERAMILWMEWFAVCTCSSLNKEKIIKHIRTVAIPLIFKNELSHPNCDIYYKARMNYCWMLQELTSAPVTYKDALQMYLSNEDIHQQLTLGDIYLAL